jgi:AcrR family transcriptional regulator
VVSVRRTGQQNRDEVLGVATRLFYERGIRAVGMDTIVKEAGVGNATVYRQFPNKDALATAFVQGCADAWFERMRQQTDPIDDPREKIAAVFEALAEDAAQPSYRGCPMLNTSTEYPGGEHPAHRVAVTHKEQVRDWFRSLADEAGVDDPDRLADELLIILNGAYATTAVLDPRTYGPRAAALARRLVDPASAR